MRKRVKVKIISWPSRPKKISAHQEKKIKKFAHCVVKEEHLDKNINIVIVDNKTILELKKRFFGEAVVTDVIAFDYKDEKFNREESSIGEIVVSVEKARNESKKRGIDFERELLLYIIHGILHLCGYDDLNLTQRKKMKNRENYFLKKFGY